MFITTSPFWMIGMEALLPGGERLHLPTVLGMLVGFTGTLLLIVPVLQGGYGCREEVLIGDNGGSGGLRPRAPDHNHGVMARIDVNELAEDAERQERILMNWGGGGSEAPPHVPVIDDMRAYALG